MQNYEQCITKAVAKARKRYAAQYNDPSTIYVELETISLCYDEDGSWAEVALRWGNDGEVNPFQYRASIMVHSDVLRGLDSYILGYMTAVEDADFD